MTKEERIADVVKCYLNGIYNNRELAKKHSVSSQTICNWINKSQIIKYLRIKKKLEKELNKYLDNGLEYSDKIGRLIVDIENINKLIEDVQS